MSHLMPPPGHKAREMFDTAQLVAVSTGQEPVRTSIPKLRERAIEWLRGSGARRACYFWVDCRGDLWLISFGRLGGLKREWRFGPMTTQTRLL